jgi:hypothetical protein
MQEQTGVAGVIGECGPFQPKSLEFRDREIEAPLRGLGLSVVHLGQCGEHSALWKVVVVLDFLFENAEQEPTVLIAAIWREQRPHVLVALEPVGQRRMHALIKGLQVFGFPRPFGMNSLSGPLRVLKIAEGSLTCSGGSFTTDRHDLIHIPRRFSLHTEALLESDPEASAVILLTKDLR